MECKIFINTMNRSQLNALSGFLDGTATTKLKEIDTGTPNVWASVPHEVRCVSPRCKWREEHGIRAYYSPNQSRCNEWIAVLNNSHAHGDTEDAAEFNLCEKMGIQHWSVLP